MRKIKYKTDCQEFLKSLFAYDSTNCPTAYQVACHHWLFVFAHFPPRHPLLISSIEPIVLDKMKDVMFHLGKKYSRKEMKAKMVRKMKNKGYRTGLLEYVTPADSYGWKEVSTKDLQDPGFLNQLGQKPAKKPFGPAGTDPLHGYHPLVSLYFLVREKMAKSDERWFYISSGNIYNL